METWSLGFALVSVVVATILCGIAFAQLIGVANPVF
jgi:hypothetical protein